MNCPKCGRTLRKKQCGCGLRLDNDPISVVGASPKQVIQPLQAYIVSEVDRKKAEEEKKRRLKTEAEIKRRRESEERARRQKEAEEVARRQKEASEEVARQRLAVEAEQRRLAMQAEKQHKELEDAARRQKELEDAARRQKELEDAARRQRELEDAASRQKELEDAERRRQAAEEVKQRQQAAEREAERKRRELSEQLEKEAIARLPKQIRVYPNTQRPIPLLSERYIRQVLRVDLAVKAFLPAACIAFIVALFMFFYQHSISIFIYGVTLLLFYIAMCANQGGTATYPVIAGRTPFSIQIGFDYDPWVTIISVFCVAIICTALRRLSPLSVFGTEETVLVTFIYVFFGNAILFYPGNVISEFLVEQLLKDRQSQ